MKWKRKYWPWVHSESLKPLRQLLVGFDDELNEILGKIPVLVVEERRGEAKVAHTAGTTDTVDILFHVRRHVKVDDVLDIGDIQATRSNLTFQMKKVSAVSTTTIPFYFNIFCSASYLDYLEKV